MSKSFIVFFMGGGSLAGFRGEPQRLKCVCTSLFPGGVGSALSLSNRTIEKYSKMLVDSPGLETRGQVCSSKKELRSSLEM